MKKLFLLFTVHYTLFTITVQSQVKTINEQQAKNDGQLKYKIILKDSGIFHGSTIDKKIYIVTAYARINLKLSEIDSVEIGILPYYLKEKKILSLLKQLDSDNKEKKEKAYKKLISMRIGALPVIRNYINKDTVRNRNTIVKSRMSAAGNKYTPEEVLNELETKYKVNRDFIDRDIIYMHTNFKIGGIFTVRKKRALIKFGKFVFPRDEIKKIIFLH